jgi:hypothetical protein
LVTFECCAAPAAFPLGKAAVNFTTEDIFEAMRHGQHAVWAKLPAIQAACAIEVCIEELLQQVTLQVRQQDKLERVMAQASCPGCQCCSTLRCFLVEGLCLALEVGPRGAEPPQDSAADAW